MLCFDTAATFNNDAWDDTTGLYLRCTPYIESAASRFNSLGDFTTVVVGQMSAAHNTIFIHLGSSNYGSGLVIATTDNDNEVIIAKNTTTTVDFANGVKATVPNAATARHAYVIVKKGSVFTVWVDGVKRGSIDVGDSFTLGASSHAGLQVGKQFGGYALGSLNGVSSSDTGVINVIRIFDYAISESQSQAIFSAYPYVPLGGLYTRTITADANLSATDAWTKSGGDTTHALPEGATVDAVFYNPSATLTVDADATLVLNADLTLDKLTVGSTGGSALSVVSDGAYSVQVSDVAIINSPLTITYGALNLAGTPVQLGKDATLCFDCSALDLSGVYQTTRYQLTGLMDRDDEKVTVVVPTAVARTASKNYNASGYYELVVTPDHEAGSDVYYTGGYWGTTESTFAVTNSSGNATVVFPGDTVVIPANITGGNASSAYFGATLPANVSAIRVEKDYTFESGVDDTAILGGATVTVAEGCTLSFATSWHNLTLGALTFTGPGGVNIPALSRTASISGAVSGTARVTVNGSVSVASTGSIANTISGSGTITYTAFPSTTPAGFSSWTGTVALPSLNVEALNLNAFGVIGSKVALAGITGGYLAINNLSINPELVLNGDVSIPAMSAAAYTFAKISGSGNLSLASNNEQPTSFTITEVAEGYTGTISSSLTTPVTITTLARQAGTSTAGGTKLLSTSGDVVAGALTVGGVASSASLYTKSDGIYIAAASVTINDETTYYDTVSAAVAAFGSAEGTLTLLSSTDASIALSAGQTLVNGNLTTGGVTGPNGYEVVNNNGIYTLVDNTASTWSPGENSDYKWNNANNWSTGYCPSQYTAVTFPASESAHEVKLEINDGNPRHHCASMVLNGDVTFKRIDGGPWAYVFLYGDVSGTGTMTLERTGLNTQTNGSVTISCPVVGNASANDNFFSGSYSNATYTFSSTVDVAAGEFKADYTDLIFNGLVTIRNGGFITVNHDNASTEFNGGISVPAGASASLRLSNTTSGHTIASTVTLGLGATLTIPNSTVTNDATFVASAQGYHVVSTVSGATTVYSVEAIPSSAEIGEATFEYGVDFTNATVTVAVTETNASGVEYTLTVGGKDYTASAVGGTTVTFNNVEIPRGAAYGPVGYNITSTASSTTGATSGSATVADVTADWINENATTHGQAAAGGVWTNAEAVSYSNGKAAISDNRFAATTASTASRVVLEFEVCFSSTSEEDVSGEAQAAIKLGAVNDATTFMVLTTGNTWTPVSNAELPINPSETYNVALTIDYGTSTYKVDVEGKSMTNSTGSASFSLATSKATVQNIDFVGSGTLTSMKGDQLEGYMVKDALNHFYATIEAATQAYNSANGPYIVLHDGTAPSGWKIDNATKKLIKIAKGLFFMAY